MRFTNKHDIPKEMFNALCGDGGYYNKNSDYSVTELLKPAQMRMLEKRHSDEIEVDASDRIWMLFGRAIHSVMEEFGDIPFTLKEERLSVEVKGRRVTGQVDLLREGTLIDYKVTSVYSFLLGPKKEWEEQLNLYRLLCEENGFRVDSIEIHAILRDWQKSKTLKDSKYPKTNIVIFKIPIWEKGITLEFLDSRVKLHESAKESSDENLPMCTSQEKWERPRKIALMKKGRKSAIRLFDDIVPADKALKSAIETQKGSFYLQIREGVNVRCENFCLAQPFCYQYSLEHKSREEK